MTGAASASTDHAELWEQVRGKIPARGFLRTLVDSLVAVGTEGRAFILAYPPEEKSTIETLTSASNKRQLETLLKDISGRDWTVKFESREGLPIRQTSEKPAAAQTEKYKDDPLIQEALEMFKGEIRS